jgi:DNA-dependent RNA polymerase auxiliary subunit epsilon
MQDIALKIDEEQLNVYITMDYDPQPEDDSTISSAEADFSNFADFSNAEGWEDFTEWAFAPSAAETDASSSFNTSGGGTTSGEDSGDAPAEGVQAALSPRPTIVLDLAEKDLLDESLENAEAPTMPQAIVQFNDYLEDDSESEDYRYELKDSRRASSFLKKISEEEVSYESDSEAVDSWAQDGESGSRASSGTTLTYDPARIAFRELMNKVPHMSVSPPPPPNSPSDMTSRKTRGGNRSPDPWATFDFATVRQTSVI